MDSGELQDQWSSCLFLSPAEFLYIPVRPFASLSVRLSVRTKNFVSTDQNSMKIVINIYLYNELMQVKFKKKHAITFMKLKINIYRCKMLNHIKFCLTGSFIRTNADECV